MLYRYIIQMVGDIQGRRFLPHSRAADVRARGSWPAGSTRVSSRAKAAARSPKQFARSGRAWLRVPLLQNCELLPQGQILQQKIISGSKRTNQKGECELQRTEQKPFVTEIASDPLFLMLQAKTRADTFNPRSTPQSFSASWIINHLDGLT